MRDNTITSDNHRRQAVRLVDPLNLAYFAVELAIAPSIGWMSRFADSVDLLENAAVDFLIFVALALSKTRRAKVGMTLSSIRVSRRKGVRFPDLALGSRRAASAKCGHKPMKPRLRYRPRLRSRGEGSGAGGSGFTRAAARFRA